MAKWSSIRSNSGLWCVVQHIITILRHLSSSRQQRESRWDSICADWSLGGAAWFSFSLILLLMFNIREPISVLGGLRKVIAHTYQTKCSLIDSMYLACNNISMNAFISAFTEYQLYGLVFVVDFMKEQVWRSAQDTHSWDGISPSGIFLSKIHDVRTFDFDVLLQ